MRAVLRLAAASTALLALAACLAKPEAVAAEPAASAPGAVRAPRGATKKRAAPEPAEPIVVSGVRYEVVPWARSRGFGQDGGIVRAVDAQSAKERWLLQVYDTAIDPAKERDVQEVFITRLAAAADGRSLLVDTDRGARYRVDLATRAVCREAGPGPGATC